MSLPVLADPTKKHVWRRYLWLLVFVVVVVIGGIIGGLLWGQSTTSEEEELTGGRQLLIERIDLGALVRDADPAALNPTFAAKSIYTTADKLVLRVTTTPSVTTPFDLSARLLTGNGVIIELDPPVAEFQPGVSSFCCWQIEEPGKYTLQLFRPEKVVTSLPIEVLRGTQGGAADALK